MLADYQDLPKMEKIAYSSSLEIEIEVTVGMNAEPEHQNADGDSKHKEACQTFLKPYKDKTDKGCQER